MTVTAQDRTEEAACLGRGASYRHSPATASTLQRLSSEPLTLAGFKVPRAGLAFAQPRSIIVSPCHSLGLDALRLGSSR